LLKWTLQEKNDEARTENTKNEEGDKLYNEWLEASMFIQTEEYDDLWNSLTSQWDNHIKEYFVKWKICTQEEWEMYFAEGLTDYEKFCWTNFYGLFVHSVNLDSPASYFKDEKAVHSRFVMIFSGLIKNRLEKNHPAQYERIDKAYKDLIYWQYTYFLENGDFYCFMTGGTYRGKNNVTASALLDAVKKDEERQNQELDAIENRFGENDKNTQKIDDIAEEIKTETVNENATLPSENITPTPETPTPEEIRESDSPQNEEKKGLSNILNAIRKNIISFTIGILAFTIVGVLHVIKKKKEKDNSEEDDDDGDE
jgi:hypothetical protein